MGAGSRRDYYAVRPPQDFLEILAIDALNWASGIASNAFGDELLKKQAREFDPLDTSSHSKELAERDAAQTGGVCSLRGEEQKQKRGRTKRAAAWGKLVVRGQPASNKPEASPVLSADNGPTGGRWLPICKFFTNR